MAVEPSPPTREHPVLRDVAPLALPISDCVAAGLGYDNVAGECQPGKELPSAT